MFRGPSAKLWVACAFELNIVVLAGMNPYTTPNSLEVGRPRNIVWIEAFFFKAPG